MQLSDSTHLCYSLNVFPGEDWRRLSILREKLPLLRKLIPGAAANPFALGLWLPAEAAHDLASDPSLISSLHSFLAENNCYVYTVNAFPYGVFHGRRVKEAVYQPDWSTDSRRKHTCTVAKILSELLPDGLSGSISTLPGKYGKSNAETLANITNNLLETASFLKKIESESGKKIVLAVEMEPDCLWDDPQVFADYYQKNIAPHKELAPYIGVCYDTCHQELTGRKPGEGLRILKNAEIPIAKIQLSAALRADNPASKDTLANEYCDEVYLHQTRTINAGGEISCFPDLPDALASADRKLPWLVHFHVPLYTDDFGGGLSSAKSELLASLSEIVKCPGLCPHLEIETYTYAVLPGHVRKPSIEESMAAEYEFVFRQWHSLKRENS